MGDREVQDMMLLMASKIHKIAERMSDAEVDGLVSEINCARRVFVMGAGRSGLVAKAFAMRLMHLGLQSFVVGETITPALRQGDLVVVFSGSGETKTIADLAETAKNLGARVALITYKKDSRIGRIADHVVMIPSQREKIGEESQEFEVRQMMGEHKSFAPLGTLFETAAMVFADAIISRLMDIRECNIEELRGRHANIE
ncbi:MAG: 6-phospho-3-hexuloisomerase [Methanomicrobiales archaeon]|nr:6-phospho-3-hexuloisomerase [Methanomicrobiales archaeon]